MHIQVFATGLMAGEIRRNGEFWKIFWKSKITYLLIYNYNKVDESRTLVVWYLFTKAVWKKANF